MQLRMIILICMNTELDQEIEFLEMLIRYCLTVRGMRKKPELAGVVGRREIKLKRELAELQAEKARVETPELALQHHEVSA